MPGLVPGIHVLTHRARKTWMAGTSPAMTDGESRRSFGYRSISFTRYASTCALSRCSDAVGAARSTR